MNDKVAPWVPCLECNVPLEVNNSLFDSFFKSNFLCFKCHSPIEIEPLIKRAIHMNRMMNGVFNLLGLSSKRIKFTLDKNKVTVLNFTDNGIPEDSRIVWINYTTQGGGLCAVQIHGNTPFMSLPQKEVALYPVPIGEAKEKSEVIAFVMWSEDDESYMKYLIDAINHYNHKSYTECITPLNIAIETLLKNVLFKHFSDVWDSKVANRMMNTLDYGYILNKLYPDMIEANRWIVLPKNVRKNLTNLLEYRNQIVHSGKLEKSIDKDELVDIMTSVFIAYHFCRKVLD